MDRLIACLVDREVVLEVSGWLSQWIGGIPFACMYVCMWVGLD